MPHLSNDREESPLNSARAESTDAKLAALLEHAQGGDAALRWDAVDRLILLAKDKTEQIYLASFPTALPDVRKGIRVKAG